MPLKAAADWPINVIKLRRLPIGCAALQPQAQERGPLAEWRDGFPAAKTRAVRMEKEMSLFRT